MFILLTVYGRIHTRGVTCNDQEILVKQNLLITLFTSLPLPSHEHHYIHKPSSPQCKNTSHELSIIICEWRPTLTLRSYFNEIITLVHCLFKV